jgi:hypothetical protein
LHNKRDDVHEEIPFPIPWQRKGNLLLSNILLEVEALTNQEVELRSKIETVGLEVTKVPSNSTKQLDELEIAKELDRLSAKELDIG